MTDRDKFLARLKQAKRESKYIEFKREFDTNSAAAWCEVIKDIVALANSNGGAILFGVENNGAIAPIELKPILQIDIADITNRIQRYTGYQFADIEAMEIIRTDGTCVALLIGAADIPMVFTRPGTYDIGGGKQRTAFGMGTIYFRHGGKSEPGNRDDLIEWREREIARVKESWLGGIRKVVEAPEGHTVTVLPAVDVGVSGKLTPIKAQVSADADAVKVIPYNAEELWPYRQKELLSRVNSELREGHKLNGHDMLCINRTFDILKTHPDFAYKPHRLSSPQYSQSFVDWIAEQVRKDAAFANKAREAYHRAT